MTARVDEKSKSAKNQEVTTIGAGDHAAIDIRPEVPINDSTDIKNVSCSDNQDDKLSNKPEMDAELSEIIEAWPKLHGVIRSAIVAAIRASAGSFP